jgi:hypothetical protein
MWGLRANGEHSLEGRHIDQHGTQQHGFDQRRIVGDRSDRSVRQHAGLH